VTAIDAAFRRLRASGEKGLVVYLTAGDPAPAASLRYLRAAADAGADIIEVGVPFSDPTADGPTIAAASRRALASGMKVAGALELVRRFRGTHATPIVLFGYCNPFHRYGWPSLCKDAREAGVDGFLVVDLPFRRGEMRCRGSGKRGSTGSPWRLRRAGWPGSGPSTARAPDSCT